MMHVLSFTPLPLYLISIENRYSSVFICGSTALAFSRRIFAIASRP
ncbi:MAG: hypothetical protein F6K28_32165 [Microcoleus sp. SIO2G3]|nr:hypothetical protein [Microcoleus sp. SIO2G3]